MTKRRLEKWQDELIRQNIWEMPIDELAKLAKVEPAYIYTRRRSTANPQFSEPQKKKAMVRPPAIYSNTKWYHEI